MTGRSTVPVPMKSENSEPAFAGSSVREYDASVIVGRMKLGLVTGSNEENVPLDLVNSTKSTGCVVAGAPKIWVLPLGP